MDPAPREMRLSSAVRGLIIGGLIAGYAYALHQPAATFTVALLIAAGLQLAVLLLRKFVAPYLMPQALHVFELLVDGATVLLFALGVFGSVATMRRMMEHGLTIDEADGLTAFSGAAGGVVCGACERERMPWSTRSFASVWSRVTSSTWYPRPR